MLESLLSLFRPASPARRPHARRTVRPSFDALEDRTVPAAQSVVGGLATPTGAFAPEAKTAQLAAQQSDTQFLTEAVQGDEQEMILGSLATVLGTRPGVRRFGEILLHDHAEMFASAMFLLRKEGLSLEGPSADMLRHIQDIASRRGADFDRAFVDYMVDDHRKDVQDFRDEINDGNNSDIQRYAAAWVRTIQKHLSIALALQRTQGSSSGTLTLPTVPPSLGAEDRKFLTEATEGDQQEMILGSLATVYGVRPGVHVYGRILLHDHALMLASAMPLMNKYGLSLEPPSEDMLQHMQDIGTRRGRDFDRAFIDYMVEDHTKDVQDFRDEINDGQNSDVQNYARRWLPTIERHLRIAELIQRRIQSADGQMSQ